MRALKVVTAACSLWLLVVQCAIAEDLTIVSEVTGGHIVGSVRETLWISADKIRWSRPRMDRIYDVATGKQIDLDHKTRQYWEGTEAEFLAALAADTKKLLERPKSSLLSLLDGLGAKTPELEHLRKKVEQFERKLDQLNQEARAKKARDSTAIFSVAVEKDIGTKMIAGYDCEQYLVWVTRTYPDGSKEAELFQELWVAPKLEAPVSFEVMLRSPILGAYRPPFTAAGMKGVPLGLVLRGEFDRSVVAIDVKKGPLDAAVFAVPAGYTRVNSPI
jgi:hypothetical protein